MMDIAAYVKTRYTTKAFDPTRKIGAEDLAVIKDLLRYTPSSTNAQPWHFILAGSDKAKEAVRQSVTGFYAFNEDKVKNASHVAVLCSRTEISDAYLESVLHQEDMDGRFANDEARAGQHRGRSFFVHSHRFTNRDVQSWAEKQTYIALGFLLLGVATLGVDACPIEGFDRAILDKELGLSEKGFSSMVIVPLGYRAADDFNAKLPKSRLPESVVIEEI